MVADAGVTSSASRRARMGSSDTSAAAGSSMTATSNMAPRSHRQTLLSRRWKWSEPARLSFLHARVRTQRDDPVTDRLGRVTQDHQIPLGGHGCEEVVTL